MEDTNNEDEVKSEDRRANYELFRLKITSVAHQYLRFVEGHIIIKI